MSRSAFAIEVDELEVARARRGDLAAMERLFRTFQTPVFNLARRLCGSHPDAEDVLQETFLEIFRSVHAFRGEGSFAGWVRRVATSKAFMRLRKRRPLELEDPLEGDFPANDGRPGDAATARVDLEVALARLPEATRAVIWLHEVEGYSHEEIGELLGKTASFSKSQLARGVVRLRDCLDVEMEGTCTRPSTSC